MTIQDISELLVTRLGDNVVAGIEEKGLQPALLVEPDRIADVCLVLRDDPQTWFDFLACITGVDHGVSENRFSVVYHLSSIPHKRQLTLKAVRHFDRTLQAMPWFPTVSHIWRTAEWHERETFDLLGIFFEGHPDLRRIFLPDDWEGYPLRKDYQTAENYRGIKIDF